MKQCLIIYRIIKKIAYLFPIPFEIFFICYILACDKGYNGHNCNAICSFPTYGLDCQSMVNCTETFCDPVDGCTGHTTEIGIKNSFYFILQCILISIFSMFR